MSQDALLSALLAEGGILAEHARSPGARDGGREDGPAQRAASGPRTAGYTSEYELLLEMILEGSLLHYGAPRVVSAADPDMALLLGDQLYALGLARLAALGDLDAVTVLADVISQLARAHAEGDPARADAIWADGAVEIGWGRGAAGSAAGEASGPAPS